jgi:phage gpG-like protein
MPQQGISIKVKGLKEFNKKMTQSNKKMSQGRRLHARIGTNLLKLVHKGFKTDGVAVTGKKWKNLERSTIAARRKGSGEGNPLILRNNRTLERSFTPDWNEKEARVGPAIKYSKPHEFGGKRKYKIKPKRTGGRLKYINKNGNFVYPKEVTHPPLPQRKMLPTKKIAQPIVNKTYDNFVKNAYKKVVK